MKWNSFLFSFKLYMSLTDVISWICASPYYTEFKLIVQLHSFTVHFLQTHSWDTITDQDRGAFSSWRTRCCLDLKWTSIKPLLVHTVSASFYISSRLLFSSLQPAWENASFTRAAVIFWSRAAAGMNASDEEGLLGNSTWDYSYYHQNFTLQPPLLPDKTSTSKPAACEQVHIAIEVSVELSPSATLLSSVSSGLNPESSLFVFLAWLYMENI